MFSKVYWMTPMCSQVQLLHIQPDPNHENRKVTVFYFHSTVSSWRSGMTSYYSFLPVNNSIWQRVNTSAFFSAFFSAESVPYPVSGSISPCLWCLYHLMRIPLINSNYLSVWLFRLSHSDKQLYHLRVIFIVLFSEEDRPLLCGMKTAVTQGCTRYHCGHPENDLRCRDVEQETQAFNHRLRFKSPFHYVPTGIILPLRALVST